MPVTKEALKNFFAEANTTLSSLNCHPKKKDKYKLRPRRIADLPPNLSSMVVATIK